MILSIDFGDRFIGLAAGQPPDVPVHRYGVIDCRQHDALTTIAEIVEKERVSLVLVGVPMGFSGEETQQTHKSLAFIEQLQMKLHPNVDIQSVDETLTSAQASRIIAVEGANKTDEHAEAARLMLVDYLARKV